jgi:MFS transporter, DHA1 family, multidrug resistance protein
MTRRFPRLAAVVPTSATPGTATPSPARGRRRAEGGRTRTSRTRAQAPGGPPRAVPASQAPADSAPEGRRYVQLVLVLGSLIALGPLSIDMYLPALPALAADLRAEDAAVQATLTGMLLGLGLGQLVIGPLSDAVGRRLPLLLGLVAHAGTSALCAFSPDVLTLTGARALQGVAGAAVSVVAMAMIRDLFTGVAAARLLSRLMLVMGVAPVLAPTLGGVLLRLTSWRGIFAVLAGFAVVLVVVAALGLRETLPPHRRRSAHPAATLRTYGMLLRDGTFVLLAAVSGLVFATMFSYISGSPFVLQDVYGLDAQEYAVAFGVNAAGIIAFTQINPVLLRRFDPLQVLTAAVTIQAVAAVLLVVAAATGVGGLPVVLAALWVVVALCGLGFPNTPALALSRHGEAAGTAAALLGATGFGIGGLAAPLVGLLGTGSALPMAVVMLVATFAAVALLALVRRRTVREAAAGATA